MVCLIFVQCRICKQFTALPLLRHQGITLAVDGKAAGRSPAVAVADNQDYAVPICLGPLSLCPPVMLAPLAGITDLPFRRLVGRLGAGLVVREMLA